MLEMGRPKKRARVCSWSAGAHGTSLAIDAEQAAAIRLVCCIRTGAFLSAAILRTSNLELRNGLALH
ncbi:hypothetical protein BST61_g10715 [Cercospora zeina]